MDYKEKYEEALNKAKEIYCRNDATDGGKIILEGIFPELKESEDELKWLTEFIREEAYYLSMDIRDNEDRIKLKNLQRSLAWLEKQGEQKPDDKVEPKFKIGDCIKYRGDNYRIKDIEKCGNNFIYNVTVIGKPADPEEVKTSIGWAAEKDMVKIEQKPNVYEWSEHQHKLLNYAISMTKDGLILSKKE